MATDPRRAYGLVRSTAACHTRAVELARWRSVSRAEKPKHDCTRTRASHTLGRAAARDGAEMHAHATDTKSSDNDRPEHARGTDMA